MQDLIIGTILLLIAFLASLKNYENLKSAGLQIFPYYLLTSLVIQTGGYYYSAYFKESNHFIFNIYILIENSFFIYIFYLALERDTFKQAIIIAATVFYAYYLYEVIYLDHFSIYSAETSNMGNLVTLFCCILYFSEILIAEQQLNFFMLPMFWICTGIMIAAVGNFLYLCFFQYILQNNLDPDGKVYGVITTLISVIEYSFFTIGFYCKKIWTIDK